MDQGAVTTFDAHEIYRECALFAPCTLCFIRELVSTGGPSVWRGLSFDSGAVVYAAGEGGSSAFVVARGIAEAITPTSGGSLGASGVPMPLEGVVRTLNQGDHFGEAQALGVLPTRQETVRAKTALHLLEVSCSLLTRLLMQTFDSEAQEEARAARAAAAEAWGPGEAHSSQGSLHAASREAVSERSVATSSRSGAGSGGAGSAAGGRAGSGDEEEAPTTLLGGRGRTRHVFLEERRHFEREAAKLYAQLHPKGGQGGLGATLNLGRSLRAGPAAGGAAGAEFEAWGEEVPARPSADAARRPVTAPTAAGASAVPGSPRAATAVPQARPPTAVSGLENPRRWRQQVAQAQAALMEGAYGEEGGRGDKLLERLRNDLRRDIKQGNMVPPDAFRVMHMHDPGGVPALGREDPKAARGGGEGGAGGGGASQRPSVSVPAPTKRQPSKERGKTPGAVGPEKLLSVLASLRGNRPREDEDDDDRSVISGTTGAGGAIGARQPLLDLDLLPPLSFATPRQKHMLMQELERHARLGRTARKAALRQRVGAGACGRPSKLVPGTPSSTTNSLQLSPTSTVNGGLLAVATLRVPSGSTLAEAPSISTLAVTSTMGMAADGARSPVLNFDMMAAPF